MDWPFAGNRLPKLPGLCGFWTLKLKMQIQSFVWKDNWNFESGLSEYFLLISCGTIGHFDSPVRYRSLRFYPIRRFRMGEKVLCATGKRPRFEPR